MLTTGILYVAAGQKGKLLQTYPAIADADVTSNWGDIESGNALTDGTKVSSAFLFQEIDPGFSLYALNGNLIPTRGTIIDRIPDSTPNSISQSLNPGTRAQNSLRIATAPIDGQIFTIGTDTYEIDTDGIVTPGNIPVLMAGVAAVGTLTFTTNAADGDTAIVGPKTYTLQAVLTNVNGNVLIGATSADTIDNLVAAIMLGTGAGTKYAQAMTLHPSVTAVKASATTMTTTAKTPGTAGNAIGTTKVSTHFAFGATTLLTGADPTPTVATAAIVLAINSSATNGVSAVLISINQVDIIADKVGVNALATTETLVGANNSFAAATMYGGSDAGVVRLAKISRVPTAVEVALGEMSFYFDFPPDPNSLDIRIILTATPGIALAWDGVPVVVGNRVTIGNGGVVDWAVTNTVIVDARL